MMDGTGDHLFAGSTLAQNQHRVRALRCLTYHAIETLHLRRASDDIAKTLSGLDPLTQPALFRLLLEAGFCSFQKELQIPHTERLGQVIGGAVLHGLHGRVDGGMGAGDIEAVIWTSPLEAPK